jgi:cytochrome c oxidase subunit 1
MYYWFPKMFGRHLNPLLGKIHFWGSVICMNGIFFPMFIQGLAGMQRRLYDPTVQLHNQSTQYLSPFQLVSAVALLLFQFPFLYNIFHSMFKGEKAAENPWDVTTLEWACPSPPPHGNFPTAPVAHRAPYEYSVPGRAKDFFPQWEKN